MNLLIAVSSLALLAGQPQSASYSASAMHQQLVCAPQMLTTAPLGGIRVLGNANRNRYMFTSGEGIIVDAGNTQGIKAGQQYFVRRVVDDQFIGQVQNDLQPVSIHTAGWVTIVDVRDNVAVAQVTHACDGILVGDYLEAYVEPADPPAAAIDGAPDYAHAASIVMGDDKRQMGGAGTLMMIDRGGDADVKPGQTVTFFRDTMSGLGPAAQIGQGTVLTVRPESALVRIDSSHDAVFVGDRAAINRLAK
jgi:hypothetical protein